ncbi:hypothetical protein OsJ_31994 [Oryza sativa Japonica Group]|uniref:Uncharacterized protein n=1 Tax=Oryza sativa subsp. japonica TaxID=39947 RepID=Q9FWU9_ORYSJ|nr:hypothetical protein [Oryza sativa Japonica Group]EEE51188.1 hypothetical protein OsJ_31994 [Oryza sativa Japonica Group]
MTVTTLAVMGRRNMEKEADALHLVDGATCRGGRTPATLLTVQREEGGGHRRRQSRPTRKGGPNEAPLVEQPRAHDAKEALDRMPMRLALARSPFRHGCLLVLVYTITTPHLSRRVGRLISVTGIEDRGGFC